MDKPKEKDMSLDTKKKTEKPSSEIQPSESEVVRQKAKSGQVWSKIKKILQDI